MAAPVRNGIKLNTMRELHLVALVEPPSLLVPLRSSTLLSFGLTSASPGVFVRV